MSLLLARIAQAHRNSGAGDPYWNSVVSLLHFDGADGSTAFTDEKGLVWTPWGSAKISAAPRKFGTGALNNASAGGILVPNNAGFTVGSDDWTIELFLYLSGPSVNVGRIINPNSDTYDFLSMNISSSNVLSVYSSSNGGSWNVVSNASVATIAANTWTHIAVCRQESSINAFINGIKNVLSSTVGTTSLFSNSGVRCLFGQNVGTQRYIIGSGDEFRFTKGVARYTTSFTPPTAPFPNHA